VPSRTSRFVAGCLAATRAFWAYTATLLPGVDAGDTGGFQAAVLWPEISARQAYPLYYNLGYLFVRLASPHNPARGLNLFSAVWGAAAVGLLTSLAASLTASVGAGLVAGLLLAFSYTFWTQAIIAEVYTLHLVLILLCLVSLRAYAARPGPGRLAIFFGVYACAFGNHLSMILLLVPFAAFLIATTPEPRALLRPRVILLAAAIAAAGALQYWPNLMAIWRAPDAPVSAVDRLAAFWFDVTKSDWRASMVLGIEPADGANRLGMWWFDLRQQFGVAGVLLAVGGVAALWRRTRVWAATLLGAFVMSTAFAFTYNVGDAHVFFLPSHLFTALFAGAIVAAIPRDRRRVAACCTAALLLYAGWRGWDTWPVVDRHADRRGEDLIARLTFGISQRSALLVTQLDWQTENVLLYYGRYINPGLAWVRLPNVLPVLPFLVADTHAAMRDVALTADAARDVVAAYGPAFPLSEDPTLPSATFGEAVARMPRGAPYVLCLLTPPRDQPLDALAFSTALRQLTGNHAPEPAGAPYFVVAGRVGETPSFVRAAALPFRASFRILDEPFAVRMESWLGTDTFRRAGFGHVLHGRNHVLIVERGVSLVWLMPGGEAAPPVYAAGLYAMRPRFVIPAGAPRLASVDARP
jgi:hypothetical protein